MAHGSVHGSRFTVHHSPSVGSITTCKIAERRTSMHGILPLPLPLLTPQYTRLPVLCCTASESHPQFQYSLSHFGEALSFATTIFTISPFAFLNHPTLLSFGERTIFLSSLPFTSQFETPLRQGDYTTRSLFITTLLRASVGSRITSSQARLITNKWGRKQ